MNKENELKTFSQLAYERPDFEEIKKFYTRLNEKLKMRIALKK